MMTVIGTRRIDFTAQDGKTISGCNFYVSEPLEPNVGKGASCERIFMSDTKLAGMTYLPDVGDMVVANYNRYGKVDYFTKVDQPARFPNEAKK